MSQYNEALGWVLKIEAGHVVFILPRTVACTACALAIPGTMQNRFCALIMTGIVTVIAFWGTSFNV